MATLPIKKVAALPSTFEPNALYIVNSSSSKSAVYIADRLGNTLRELTSPTQQAQIDSITSSAGTSDAGIRNRLQNPQGLIDQINLGVPIDITTTSTPFICDRWKIYSSVGATIRAGRVVSEDSSTYNYIYAEVISPKASSLATDRYHIVQGIEGFNVADLKAGGSDAQAFRLTFKSCHSIAGKYCASIYNAAGNRSFVIEYNQTVPNVWEQQSGTGTMDTLGVWNTNTNGVGVNVSFDYGSGANFQIAGANTWQVSGPRVRTTGAVQSVLTTGAIVRFADIQFALATVPASFEVRPYELELSLCQRYYERIVIDQYGAYNALTAVSGISMPISWKVQKRAAPTIAIANGVAQYSGVDSMTAYQASQAASSWYLPGLVTASCDF